MNQKEVELFKKEIVACRDDIQKLDNSVDLFMNRLVTILGQLVAQQNEIVQGINELKETVAYLILQNEKGIAEAKKILLAKEPFNALRIWLDSDEYKSIKDEEK
jgi:hypothetical protein